MNKHPKHPTSISSWTRPLVELLKSSGIDPDPMIVRAGIDMAELSNPDARIPVEKMNNLWEQAVRTTGNENIGLVAAANVGPATLHALGFSFMVSSSLADAFERLRRYYRIVSDTVEVRLETQKDLFIVSLHIDETMPHAAFEALDMALTAIVMYARSLLNENLNPVTVRFRRRQPGATKIHDQIFKAPVLFDQQINQVVFRLSDVMLNLPSANADIARCNDNIVVDYLAGFSKETISDQLRPKIIESLPQGEPTVQKLANMLQTTPGKLTHALKKENTTYRAILEQIRKNLAVEYLNKPQYSIIDIAFQLGYSDSANFTRAFKRWYQTSPSQYRKDRNAKG